MRANFSTRCLIVELNRLNYTPESWQAGIHEMPRLYITSIPQRWRDRTSKEIPVVTKKRVFFRILGPLILLIPVGEGV